MAEERRLPRPPEDPEGAEPRVTWGRVGGIVLAAGASSRLGAPKAELELDGRSALARVLDVLREAGVPGGAIVVGLRPDTESLGAAPTDVDLGSFRVVTNPDPTAGRTGSLQVGLAATGGDVVLWPVDRPLASRATVMALLEAASDPEADWIVPDHEGRGHPILLRARLRAAILAAPPDADLRKVLSAAGTRRVAVPVDDPFIHANLDTPEGAAAWITRWREAGSP